MSFYNWDMLPVSQDRPGVSHRRIFGDQIQMQHLITEPGGTPSKMHNHPGKEEFFYIQAGEWEFTLGEEVRNPERVVSGLLRRCALCRWTIQQFNRQGSRHVGRILVVDGRRRHEATVRARRWFPAGGALLRLDGSPLTADS